MFSGITKSGINSDSHEVILVQQSINLQFFILISVQFILNVRLGQFDLINSYSQISQIINVEPGKIE